ncbi:MAG: Ig-like domain-containing protein [Spirochaetaceae bacterium]|nr:Ig-like domain-containing protein [Spirochaetaceae bacterium]
MKQSLVITGFLALGLHFAACDNPAASDPVAVTGVSLDQTSLVLAVNGTAPLAATVSPDNAANKAVTWASSDSDKVEVGQDGAVTGKAVTGTSPVTITVTTNDGGYTASCAVTVKALDRIAVKNLPSVTTYPIGEDADLSGLVITLTFTDETTEDVTYGGANAEDFTLTGYDKDQSGDQSVTVGYGGKTATFTVTVDTISVSLPALETGKVEQPIADKTIFCGAGAVFTAGGISPQTVTWTVNGTNLNPGTSVTGGVLAVAAADHGKQITVTAKSTADGAQSATTAAFTAVSVMPSALYGEWFWDGSSYDITDVISAVRFRRDDTDGDYHEIALTLWEAAANTDSGSKTDYPAGYRVSGTMTANKAYILTDNLTFFLSDSLQSYRYKTDSKSILPDVHVKQEGGE